MDGGSSDGTAERFRADDARHGHRRTRHEHLRGAQRGARARHPRRDRGDGRRLRARSRVARRDRGADRGGRRRRRRLLPSRSPRASSQTCVAAVNLPRDASEVDPDRFMPSARSVAYRRDAIDAVGGYPEWLDIGEDMWVDHRWRELGLDIRFAPGRRGALASALGTSHATWTQYFRYARGDAVAGMYPERHALRFATYGGLAAALASRRTWPKLAGARGRRRLRADADPARVAERRTGRATGRRPRSSVPGTDRVARHREDGGLRRRPHGASASLIGLLSPIRSRRSRGRTCARAAPQPPSAAVSPAARTARRRTPRAAPPPTESVVSRPIRSVSVSGPIGCASPRWIAVSMSSRVANPRSYRRMASYRYGIKSRLTMKPASSRACTHVFAEDLGSVGPREGEGLRRGRDGRGQLQQRHHRRRVEEVHRRPPGPAARSRSRARRWGSTTCWTRGSRRAP